MNRIRLNDFGIALYLKEIKELVSTDNFVIVSREENVKFLMKYNLTDNNKIKKILLDLRESDFKYQDDDIEYNKYGTEKVVIFIKQEKLRDLNYKEQIVNIYIKIKMKKNKLPIISFHESKEKGD